VQRKGHQSVFGTFISRANAENAVASLKRQNFRNSDISMLMPGSGTNPELGLEKSSKAPEGATAGAASGAILGGTLGWLVGIGSLAIPGVGPFIAAGPLVAALAGAGLGGTVGGISGSLIGLGIPEYEAKRYEGAIRGGAILLSVHVDNSEWLERAKTTLENCGAADISAVHEEKIESDFPIRFDTPSHP
jgi:hypothetical protein